jgi:hypothetical protein
MSWIRDSVFIEFGNKYFNNNRSATPGISPSITGTIDDKYTGSERTGRYGANVLDNCVGFAIGAFNETFINNVQDVEKAQEIHQRLSNDNFPFRLNCNANCVLDVIRRSAGKPVQDNQASLEYIDKRTSRGAAELEPYLVKFEDKPPVGGLIIWGDTNGGVDVNHIAYISDVSEDGNTITTIHSGWKYPEWTTTLYNNDGSIKGYNATTRVYSRNLKNHTYGYKGICLGYVANPAVTGQITPEDVPSIINSITQLSPTKVNISGEMGGKPPMTTHTRCYYKWGDGVSISNFDGYVDGVDLFSLDIVKPREAELITVLPMQVNSDNNNNEGEIFSQTLTPSYPCVNIRVSGVIRESIPYVWSGGMWKPIVPTLRTGQSWYKLYNTDKEKV